MTIFISIDQFENKFQHLYKLRYLSNCHIDYATNAIHAVYENEEVIIFRFSNYGLFLDNRYGIYRITIGEAGVLVIIEKIKS